MGGKAAGEVVKGLENGVGGGQHGGRKGREVTVIVSKNKYEDGLQPEEIKEVP